MPRKVWDKPSRRRRRGGTGRNRYAGRDYYGYPPQRAPRPPRVGGFLTRKRGGRAEALPAPALVTPRGQRVIDAAELTPAVKLPELHKRADASTLTTVERPKRRPLPERVTPTARLAWRYRWQLAPLLLTLAVAGRRRRVAGRRRVLAVGRRCRGAPGRTARPGADRRPNLALGA